MRCEAARGERLFIEHLGWIDRVAQVSAARFGLFGEEVEDFGAWVKMKLVENDYEVFRRHRGDSSFKTYLAVVITRWSYDYYKQRSGRWRPSAAALRLGDIAVRLERLIHRDGYQLNEAIKALQSSEAHAPDERELIQLSAQLPVRAPLRPVEIGFDKLEDPADEASADMSVRRNDATRAFSDLQIALDQALATLPPEDRVIARFHFAEGLSIGEVARALNLEQKPLYRRVERLRVKLRHLLELEGIDALKVSEALADYRDA